MMRYLTHFIENDIKRKMIILSGPRQAGKTTLSKFLIKEKGVYLNWDIRSDQSIIRDTAWPKNAPLVVLDELHKYTKWKNFLKGICDEFQNKPPLLVTGSARLGIFRHKGDALTGRYYHYRLHPIDVAEAKQFLPKEAAPQDCLNHLIKTGGFPEAFLNPHDAERLRNDRFDLVLQEDLHDLSKTNSIQGIKFLIELLRERVGGLINYSNLAEDIGVSSASIKSWIQLLENLYIVFVVRPYYAGLARSLRKEPKIYFYDCAAAYAPNNKGSLIENVTASALLKYCHFQRDSLGKNMELCYFRDREKREVDFVVTLNKRVLWCIEVKSNDDQLSGHLEYLHNRLKPVQSFQLVYELKRPKEIRGIKIVSLAEWLKELG